MKLFDLFIQNAPNRIFISIVLGALAGISYSLLIPLVMAGINDSTIAAGSEDIAIFLGVEIYQYKLATLFFAICLFVLVTRSVSQVVLMRVALDVTTDLRKTIYSRIARAPIADIERIGSPKLIATITTDVGRIVSGARAMPDLVISGVTIVGMLGFMAYLNNAVFVFVIKAIAFGVITYQIPIFIANKYFKRSRQRVDHLQGAIHGLIEGAKDLKLDANKRQRYFTDVLLAHEHAVLEADKTGSTVVRLAESYGDMISFFVIGVIAYVFINYHVITPSELTGVIMAMLYITTPIALVINAVPSMVMARISLNKIDNIMSSIPDESFPPATGEDIPAWDTLRIRGLHYRHRGSTGEAGFQVGPLDLDIRRGEVTFIVGGNGSGKSTLSKLLTLHYKADGGDILFGEKPLTRENFSAYRQKICSIYSDYHLFDRLLCEQTPEEEARIEEYMTLLKLDGKLTIEERKFSSTALSDGQRKRLALLAAILEDKELYLFDEWAADQDPSFKEIFYRRIIHSLKARGKAIIVISHDDRFFDEADRLVYMENGRVREIVDVDHRHAPLDPTTGPVVPRLYIEPAVGDYDNRTVTDKEP
jgi:putative ATP-binding cassette transporter